MSIRRFTPARIDWGRFRLPGGRRDLIIAGWIAYLYDIAIDPGPRRQGLGRQAMRRFEEAAASMGFARVLLHVFADNDAARSIYRSLGYVEESVWMGRELALPIPGPPSGTRIRRTRTSLRSRGSIRG